MTLNKTIGNIALAIGSVGVLIGAAFRAAPNDANWMNVFHLGSHLGNELMGFTERTAGTFSEEQLTESGIIAPSENPAAGIETCAAWDDACKQRQRIRNAQRNAGASNPTLIDPSLMFSGEGN
jgi:hypothetical protein